MYKSKMAIIAALAMILFIPALAMAHTTDMVVGAKNNGLSKCDERALRLYVQVHNKFGAAAAGRNQVDDGALKPDGTVIYPLPESQSCAWGQGLYDRLHPAPVTSSAPATSTTVASYTGTTTTTSAPAPVATPAPTSTGGCPSYMSGEASSPSAVNGSSGAAGCWQVIPSTAAAMGTACADVNSSSCVAAICAKQGPSAWQASGANPCPYVQP